MAAAHGVAGSRGGGGRGHSVAAGGVLAGCRPCAARGPGLCGRGPPRSRASPATFRRRSAGRAPPAQASMTSVITFDVDGTLVTSSGHAANKLHKLAFSHALKEVFGFDADIDSIKHHGMTDPLILIKMLETHDISRDEGMAKLKAMESAMVQYYEENCGKIELGLELLPGVKKLLQALQIRGDVAVGLVTGNLEPIAWAKMEALGIKDLFTEPRFGGFGSDYCSGNTSETWRDRAELVRIAAKRAAEHCPGGKVGPKYHVGDTPMDLRAADGAQAQAIGVLTGIYSRSELDSLGVDAVILENMADLAAVFEAFHLEP